jgi:DTW domain-containing protein
MVHVAPVLCNGGSPSKMTLQPDGAPRPRCVRCRRPVSVCYCGQLSELPTQTRVVILQHPRERHKAIGTARMASLCLPGSELLVGVRWDSHPGLLAALADPLRPPALLFPGPGATNILTERPAGPITLVVVDGTWSQAKTLVRDSSILQALPRFAFVAPEPSEYRIRKEPSIELVSTIEALMHVLGALEGEPARFRAMLEPFRAMVDAQLAYKALRPVTRYRRPREKPALTSRLPSALTSRLENLVCVVGESNAWPYRVDRTSHPDELVHWVAYRPSTGERFEQRAAPQMALAPSTTFHTELSEAELRSGSSRDALIEGFRSFVRPGDVIASWGHYGVSLFVRAGGVIAEHLDLRDLAHRLANRKLGSLEDAALATGAPRPPIGAGRAGRRLAALVQLVDHWQARNGFAAD